MTTWAYEEYSEWGRQIAARSDEAQIRKDLAACEFELASATGAHLRAVQGSHSMQSGSQRRAQARNNVETISAKRRALKDALEILQFHPEANALARVKGGAA